MICRVTTATSPDVGSNKGPAQSCNQHLQGSTEGTQRNQTEEVSFQSAFQHIDRKVSCGHCPRGITSAGGKTWLAALPKLDNGAFETDPEDEGAQACVGKDFPKRGDHPRQERPRSESQCLQLRIYSGETPFRTPYSHDGAEQHFISFSLMSRGEQQLKPEDIKHRTPARKPLRLQSVAATFSSQALNNTVQMLDGTSTHPQRRQANTIQLYADSLKGTSYEADSLLEVGQFFSY